MENVPQAVHFKGPCLRTLACIIIRTRPTYSVENIRIGYGRRGLVGIGHGHNFSPGLGLSEHLIFGIDLKIFKYNTNELLMKDVLESFPGWRQEVAKHGVIGYIGLFEVSSTVITSDSSVGYTSVAQSSPVFRNYFLLQ